MFRTHKQIHATFSMRFFWGEIHNQIMMEGMWKIAQNGTQSQLFQSTYYSF